MATKLKNLKITKVDFVDEGANPDAHIKMLKSRGGEEQSVGEGSEKSAGFWKRLLGFIGKAAGMNQDEIDSAVNDIQKGDSVSFNEKFNEAKNRKIADEIWDICWALQSSLCSILNDEDLDSASVSTAMQESLDEFYEVVKGLISQWSSGKAANIVKKTDEVTEADLEIMKSVVARLQAEIEKSGNGAESQESGPNNNNPEGESEEMKIDKSKMTESERAFLESLEKRYGVEDGQGAENTSAEAAPATGNPENSEVEKSAPKADVQAQEPATESADGDGIYKGLHPAVAAELAELKKFREAAEDREFKQIAKKYAILGKKEEDLVPMFKSLKAAGGTAYDDMIAVLDQAVDATEKSGVFSEVGKSGHGSSALGEAETKIDSIAKGYMKDDPNLDYTAAVARAWENNPELMSAYEEEAGF